MVTFTRARVFVLLALLLFSLIAGTVACSNNTVSLDPGTGIPLPLCPQRINLTLFAVGGVIGFPSCGGFAGNMTYPAMSAGTDTDVLLATNVDSNNANCTPTPNAVLWVVGIQPVANFTFTTAPTLTVLLPSAYVSSSFTYYYCIKDVTANIPAAPASQAGVLVNSSIVFPSSGPWAGFVANHNYRIQFYRV